MPLRQQVHIDRALTNISIAWLQSADMFVADKVFPVVPVRKQSDRYFVYSREDFFRDEAQVRARGAESAGGEYDIDNTPTYFATQYAYHKDVTENERVNADQPINVDRDATEFIMQKLMIKREFTWADKFFKSGVWGTDITGVTASPVAGTSVLKWNLATSTPIQDVARARTTVAGSTGYKLNTMVVSPDVFEALKNHEDILDRIRYVERGMVTADLLAALFEVDRFLVAWAVRNTAQKGGTENTDFIYGDHAALFYTPARPSILQPTAGYTFSWTGLLGAGAYGNRIVRFPMEHLGIGTERIEGEMAYDQKLVASELGYFFDSIV